MFEAVVLSHDLFEVGLLSESHHHRPNTERNLFDSNCSDMPVLYSLVYGNWLAAPPSGLVAMYLALYNKVSL